MAFALGETIGPYQIVDQLGQGGMATVYKAYHANLDRYVAFKVLHPAFKEDPNFLERFKREAQIVARLEHPHIVPVYDYAAHEDQPYLIMKFVEGETLKERLKRQPLTLDETLDLMDAVANALTYAHQQGVLHRDIKPSNIILDGKGTPYITDFGLARMAQAGESTLSQDMMLGTPQYISPEQAKGVYDLGPSTDIYSLGVVLYEIIVGRVPFNADTPYAIVHDHIYKPLPLPSTINPQVPAPVEWVLLRALDKDAAARFDSAVELMTALRAAVREAGMSELSVASPASPAASASTPAANTPQAAISPVPEPVYMGIPSPLPADSASASRQAYRRRANLWILGGIGALLLTCLASLFVIVSAISDPELQPWNVTDKAGAEEPRSQANTMTAALGSLTVEQAQALVANRPGDPAGYFMLALAEGRLDNRDAALDHILYAANDLSAPPELLLSAAQIAEANKHLNVASWLYLEILAQPNVPPAARARAGQFLFERSQADPGLVVSAVEQYLAKREPTPLILTMQAAALLHSNRVLNGIQARRLLDSALEMNDSLAEAYLVRGFVYEAAGQTVRANDDWRYALSFADAPQWVTDTARRALDADQDQ